MSKRQSNRWNTARTSRLEISRTIGNIPPRAPNATTIATGTHRRPAGAVTIRTRRRTGMSVTTNSNATAMAPTSSRCR
jgi:hypothetical protein